MCDATKMKRIQEEIMALKPEDTLQLILKAETREEKLFYKLIGDFLLQKEQKKAIENNMF